MENSLDKLIVVLISILSGAGGYLITTFWFQPILRYREIKHNVFSDLIFYANAINSDGMNEVMKDRMEKRIEANRRHSAALYACYKDLPIWYRKWLERSGEDPVSAASDLLGLSNTFEFDSAEKRLEKIKKNLKIYTNIV